MSGPFRLNRRTLLRGLAGSTLALPALEIMGPRSARAGGSAPPKRFVLIYCGMSLGAPFADPLAIPTSQGVGYDLPRALLPIGSRARGRS